MAAATGNEIARIVAPEKSPPHNLDAERALLGSMMMSGDAITEVIPIIGRGDADWFYLPEHKYVFEFLLDFNDDPNKVIDLVVVSDELLRRDMLKFVGGNEYLIRLAESFADWTNAEYYARLVRDTGMLRDLIRCTGEITASAYSRIDETREILDLAEQKIFAVTERRVGGRTVEIRHAVKRLVEQLEVREGGGCTGLPTGFTQLDEYTSGFQLGDLIIVAGRPSMGKTALGLSMAYHAASHDKRPVAFFSMEMSVDQVAQRLLCAHTGVDAQRLRRRMLSEEELHRLLNACADFEQTPLYIDDTPGMTAMELRSSARRLKQKHDIQAVYIDYLQLMHMPKSESRQTEIAAISRSLKALGRELSIPVIAMAQLNRMAEGRADKRPVMSDLRESGAIEQDADVVLLLHREEYYKPEDESVRNQAELIIAKQRNGPTGSVTLHFDKKVTRFTDQYVGPEPAFRERASSDNVPF